jgi:hypothetical protein
MATAALPRRTRRDIDLQRSYDERRPLGWPCLYARLEAIEEARAAIREGDSWARYALRQALIDLASVSEELASRMNAPTIRFAERGE